MHIMIGIGINSGSGDGAAPVLFATGATDLVGWSIVGGNFSLSGGNVYIDRPVNVTQIGIVSTTYNGATFPSICPNLQSFFVDSSPAFATLPVLTGLTKLATLQLTGTALTTCPNLTGLTGLVTVSFYPAIITPPTLSGLPLLSSVSFTGAAIVSATNIDNIIIQVNQSASLLGTTNGTLAIDGGTNHAPTAASAAASTHLHDVLGWTILTN